MKHFIFLLLLIFSIAPGTNVFASVCGSEFHIELINHSKGNSLILSMIASPEDTFELKYIHSVEKTPVFEIYNFDSKGQIYLTETTVESSGYGLPLAEDGDKVVYGEKTMTITGMHKRIDCLLMRVSYLNDMFLSFSLCSINLRDVACSGDQIEIKISVAVKREILNEGSCQYRWR